MNWMARALFATNGKREANPVRGIERVGGWASAEGVYGPAAAVGNHVYEGSCGNPRARR